MKRDKRRTRAALIPLSIAVATTGLANWAHAATATWTGTNRVLVTASDWANSTLPGTSDEAYFGTLALTSGVPSTLGFKGTGTTPPFRETDALSRESHASPDEGHGTPGGTWLSSHGRNATSVRGSA